MFAKPKVKVRMRRKSWGGTVISATHVTAKQRLRSFYIKERKKPGDITRSEPQHRPPHRKPQSSPQLRNRRKSPGEVVQRSA